MALVTLPVGVTMSISLLEQILETCPDLFGCCPTTETVDVCDCKMPTTIHLTITGLNASQTWAHNASALPTGTAYKGGSGFDNGSYTLTWDAAGYPPIAGGAWILDGADTNVGWVGSTDTVFRGKFVGTFTGAGAADYDVYIVVYLFPAVASLPNCLTLMIWTRFINSGLPPDSVTPFDTSFYFDVTVADIHAPNYNGGFGIPNSIYSADDSSEMCTTGTTHTMSYTVGGTEPFRPGLTLELSY